MRYSVMTAAFAERVKELARRRDSDPPSQVLSDAISEFEDGLEELMTAAEQKLYEQRKALENAQQQIQAERHRYQDLFDFAPDGYVVTDGMGVIAEANRVAADLLRVEPSHLTGKPLTVFVAETERPIFRTCLSEFQRGNRETVIAWMTRLQARGAGPVFVSVACHYTKDAIGKVNGLRWLFRDMTLTARTEDGRRASEDRFRFMFQTHPIPMWVLHLETLQFLEVNDAAVRRYGYSQDEFLGLTIKDLHPVEDLERLTPLFSPECGFVYQGEFRHRTKDGMLLDVDMTTQETAFYHQPAYLSVAIDITVHKRAERGTQGRFHHQTPGQPPHVVGLIRDITHRKQGEEEQDIRLQQLQEENRRLRASHEQLQQKVNELETFHDVAVGGELRMMALELERDALKARLKAAEQGPSHQT